MTLYEQTMALIKEVTDKALLCAKENGEIDFAEIPDYAVEEPREKEFGDFSVNAAMLMAKQARRAPRDIANIIVSNMKLFICRKCQHCTLEVILTLALF